MPVPNSPSFFPSGSTPFGRPTLPSSPAGPIPGISTKGFLGVPSRDVALSILPPVPDTGAATGEASQKAGVLGSGPASAPPVSTPVATPSRQPFVYALFLFGPGAEVLRRTYEDHVEVLDEESGEVLTWINVSDPRRSRAIALRQHEALGINKDEMYAEWLRRGAERAGDSDLIAQETALLARSFGLQHDSMPLVYLVPRNSTCAPVPIQLPRSAVHDPVSARLVVDLLRKHLHSKQVGPLEKVYGELLQERWASLVADMQLEVGSLASADEKKRIEKAARNRAVLAHLARHGSLAKAARLAGVHRSELYEDEIFMRQYEAVRATREEAKGKKPQSSRAPRGAKTAGSRPRGGSSKGGTVVQECCPQLDNSSDDENSEGLT